MNRRGWGPDEIDEHDELMRITIASSTRVADRVDVFLAGIEDAVQAGRFWANEIEEDIRRRGSNYLIKQWQRTHNRVPFSHDGQILTVPRHVGTTSVSDDGSMYYEQKLFDYLTWDAIREKRLEYIRQMGVYSERIAVLDKLLALRELAVDAETPAAAAQAIGTTVDDWLLDRKPRKSA